MTKRIDYSQLSESSKERQTTMLEKVHKTGYSLSEVKQMNIPELRVIFQTKKHLKDSTLKSYQRVCNQITFTKERKEKAIERNVPKYQKAGFKLKRLEQVENELTYTSGYTFFEIAKKIEKKYGLTEKKAEKRAKKLLLIPKSERVNLKNAFERDLLGSISP